MKTPAPPARPALTAVVAVLALASTPGLAQVAAPAADPVAPPALPQSSVPSSAPAAVVPAPILLPQVSAPAPSAPVLAPPLPEAVAEAPPSPVTARTPVATRSSPPTVAERAEPVRSAPTAAPQAPRAQGTPESVPSPAPVDVAPVITPADLRAIEARQAEPQTATVSDTNSDTPFWILGAGGAALVLGIGAIALLRRRDREEDAREADFLARPVSPAPSPAPLAPAALHREPVSSTTAPAIVRPLPAGEGQRDIEAMVAQAPSADNPFLTRRKRLRRAGFILRHGHAPAAMTPDASVAPVPVASAAAARPAPVYDFGARPRQPATFRPAGWKPATN